ncbi:MAG: hypothetical protein KI790_16540 [Cyclobacteriaceae bacterium]|nr:hypothetical protein [Cyclobacteriaceae bacterium HetDA_MAG_MS6]
MRALIVSLLFLQPIISSAQQIRLNGTTMDPTGQALGFVHIANVNENYGTTSAADGRFRIPAKISDTIQFSFIGYHMLNMVVDTDLLTKELKIVMQPDTLVLKTIWIYANREYKVPKRFKPQPLPLSELEADEDDKVIETGDILLEKRAAQGGEIPVYGPGVVFYGPFTALSKSEKEKKKYAKLTEKDKSTSAYQQFVVSDEVRDEFMTLFSISARQLDSLLIAFNREYTEAQTLSDQAALKGMLLHYLTASKK